MIIKKIYISEDRNSYMNTYFIENSQELQKDKNRPVVVVCPGGGYAFLSDREAEVIALQYVAHGYHAVVLYYGINYHAVMPGPLHDIASAVAYLREHSEQYFIDKNNIYVSGFSAGAHCAASLGVFWNNPKLLPDFADNMELIKPNGMILCYPVLDLYSSTKHLDIGIKPGADINDIDFGQKHPNMPLEKIFIMDEKECRYFVDFETAMNAYIFGGEYTSEQEDFYSLQNQVTEDTPETFIWHTAGDGLILPSNSLQFATALDKCGVRCELHIFSEGDHGLSLGTEQTSNYPHEIVPAVTPWINLALSWLDRKIGRSK